MWPSGLDAGFETMSSAVDRCSYLGPAEQTTGYIIEVPTVQDNAFMETLCDSETIKAFSFVFQESLPRGLRHFKVVSKNSISMGFLYA